MTRVNLSLRDYQVFRAVGDDLPETLATAYRAHAQGSDILRVAKHNGAVIGAYAMTAPESGETEFTLQMLNVLPPYRGNGIGRWLVGHAIGVAETKGGQSLWVPMADHSALLEGMRFTRQVSPSGYRFPMIME